MGNQILSQGMNFSTNCVFQVSLVVKPASYTVFPRLPWGRSKPHPGVVKLPVWWNLGKVLRVSALHTPHLSHRSTVQACLNDLGAFFQAWVPFSSKITESMVHFTLDHFATRWDGFVLYLPRWRLLGQCWMSIIILSFSISPDNRIAGNEGGMSLKSSSMSW